MLHSYFCGVILIHLSGGLFLQLQSEFFATIYPDSTGYTYQCYSLSHLCMKYFPQFYLDGRQHIVFRTKLHFTKK